jgi:hypothetical protein
VEQTARLQHLQHQHLLLQHLVRLLLHVLPAVLLLLNLPHLPWQQTTVQQHPSSSHSSQEGTAAEHQQQWQQAAVAAAATAVQLLQGVQVRQVTGQP